MPRPFNPLKRLTTTSISPGEEGGPSFRTWILSDFSLISSCLTARSAFPYETEKAAALPVVKHHRLRPRTYIYWVATAIGVVRPLAGLGSMDINNARCYFGRHLRPMTRVMLCLARAKVDKNPETSKKFREKVSYQLFFSIFMTTSSRYKRYLCRVLIKLLWI